MSCDVRCRADRLRWVQSFMLFSQFFFWRSVFPCPPGCLQDSFCDSVAPSGVVKRCQRGLIFCSEGTLLLSYKCVSFVSQQVEQSYHNQGIVPGLQDIIADVKFDIDDTFISSFMMDIIRGMAYLHSTKVHSHGSLKSSNCLVDTRLAVKVKRLVVGMLYTLELYYKISVPIFIS